MPRKLRIEYPGAIYHLMNRGDRREDIFKDDFDRSRFLSTLGEACKKTGAGGQVSVLTGQVSGDRRRVGDSGLASADAIDWGSNGG